MFLLLCFLSNSICNKTIDLQNKFSYESVTTVEKETICLKPKYPRTILLLKHVKDYTIVGQQKKDNEKFVGFYFGSSTDNQIELVSNSDSSFSFISGIFAPECQNITVSTLKNDVTNFTKQGKQPSCYFHNHKNSTYAIKIDADEESTLLGLNNGVKFTGKTNDFLMSSSELFIWTPSNSTTDSKASVIVGIPKKVPDCHGVKLSLNPNEFTPLVAEQHKDSHHHHHGHHHDHHHDHQEHHHGHNNYNNNQDHQNRQNGYKNDSGNNSNQYPPRYNYNNVYQNGKIIFPHFLSMLVVFVAAFFVVLIIVYLILCVCKKKSNKPQTLLNGNDVPPVEFGRRAQPQVQNIQVIPVQQQPYPQQQCVYYPDLSQVQPQNLQPIPQPVNQQFNALYQQQPQLQQQLLQPQPQQPLQQNFNQLPQVIYL